MTYVSGIRSGDHEVANALLTYADSSVEVLLSGGGVVSGPGLLHLECIGCTQKLFHNTISLVRHSNKTVALYEYVAEVKRGSCSSLTDYNDADVVIAYAPHLNEVCGRRNIVVDTGKDLIEFGGDCGSVVAKSRDNRIEMYSLFDFFVSYSVWLPDYENIYIINRPNNTCTAIKLSQTDKAKRFYLKMRMETVSYEKGNENS